MSRAILPMYPLDGVNRENCHLHLLLALPIGFFFFVEKRAAKILSALFSQL